MNRCSLDTFFEQISLSAAELKLAATSGATVSASTIIMALVSHFLQKLPGRTKRALPSMVQALWNARALVDER